MGLFPDIVLRIMGPIPGVCTGIVAPRVISSGAPVSTTENTSPLAIPLEGQGARIRLNPGDSYSTGADSMLADASFWQSLVGRRVNLHVPSQSEETMAVLSELMQTGQTAFAISARRYLTDDNVQDVFNRRLLEAVVPCAIAVFAKHERMFGGVLPPLSGYWVLRSGDNVVCSSPFEVAHLEHRNPTMSSVLRGIDSFAMADDEPFELMLFKFWPRITQINYFELAYLIYIAEELERATGKSPIGSLYHATRIGSDALVFRAQIPAKKRAVVSAPFDT